MTNPPTGKTQNHIMLDRFLARLIDGAILLIPTFVIWTVAWSMFVPTVWTLASGGGFFLAYFLTGLLVTALYIGYEAYFLGNREGQTIGKKVMRLRVLREDGRAPDMSVAIKRAGVLFGGMVLYALGGLVVALPTLGGLIVLGVALSPFLDSASGHYRGLPDKLAGTAVTRTA